MIEISFQPERPNEGFPEERATFGHLQIRADGQTLTEGFDRFINSSRKGPLVSAYHLAEWLIWNWWRLKHEPRPRTNPHRAWCFAHMLTSIGEGYVWPNITIWSDGYRSVVESKQTATAEEPAFRYFGAPTVLCSWEDVETAIDHFTGAILARLESEQVGETNLHRLWRDLERERSEQDLERYRRLEAQLGFDPDEAPETEMNARLDDAATLGEEAVGELAYQAALQSSGRTQMLSAAQIFDMTRNDGFEFVCADAMSETADWQSIAPWGTCAASDIGVAAAHAVRRMLPPGKISDEKLARIAGTSQYVLNYQPTRGPLSFALLDDNDRGHIVLSGTRDVNRRFELARLIGDRMMRSTGRLYPTTSARSYRQKAQRAFAAEFLAPIEEVIEIANGDFSDDRQDDIARNFGVSNMVIDRLLKNNRIIERNPGDYLDAP